MSLPCPLCGQPLQDINKKVANSTNPTLFCPTGVPVGGIDNWSHYISFQTENPSLRRCEALTPPFEIEWWEKEQLLTIHLLKKGELFPHDTNQIHKINNADFQSFLDTYHRLHKLKAFS